MDDIFLLSYRRIDIRTRQLLTSRQELSEQRNFMKPLKFLRRRKRRQINLTADHAHCFIHVNFMCIATIAVKQHMEELVFRCTEGSAHQSFIWGARNQGAIFVEIYKKRLHKATLKALITYTRVVTRTSMYIIISFTPDNTSSDKFLKKKKKEKKIKYNQTLKSIRSALRTCLQMRLPIYVASKQLLEKTIYVSEVT